MPAVMSRATSTKRFSVEFKADGPEGSFRARIAQFNVVDKDGDVTLPGAFPAGKEIPISVYMHGSWSPGGLPVGKGTISQDGTFAYVDGQFFLDTAAGVEHYKTLKQLGGMCEWSYGYDAKESLVGADDVAAWPGAWRVLKTVDVFEASPVLRGAGVGTGTESIKSAGDVVGGRKARALLAKLKAASGLDPQTQATIAQIDLLADELDELVDTLMDTLGIPDPDELAEGEPEETSPKAFTYPDHAKHAQASVQAFVERSKALVAMRAKEGRVLSSANRDRLATLADALGTALGDVQDLLAQTDPNEGKSHAALIERLSLVAGIEDPRLALSALHN